MAGFGQPQRFLLVRSYGGVGELEPLPLAEWPVRFGSQTAVSRPWFTQSIPFASPEMHEDVK